MGGGTTKTSTEKKRGKQNHKHNTKLSSERVAVSAVGWQNTGKEKPRGHSLLSHSLEGCMLHPGKARVLQYTCLLFTCIRSQEKWGQGHTPSLPSLPNLRNVCRSCREEHSAVRGSLWGHRPISGRQCLKHKK